MGLPPLGLPPLSMKMPTVSDEQLGKDREMIAEILARPKTGRRVATKT